MSLIVGIRAAEGLVLATDSLLRREDAVYHTARKLFTFARQPHVAVAIYGLLSLGQGAFRPVSALIDAFGATLPSAPSSILPTLLLAEQLRVYLDEQWRVLKTPADAARLKLVIAGIDPGMPNGELYWLEVPGQSPPVLQSHPGLPFFHGFWGDATATAAMTNPYYFPFDIMPLQDCADLAVHLITSTAQLETWSTKRQNIGGPVQLVTITQADGARR